MELYDYQQSSVDSIWERLYERNDLRPVVELPTGSGKSVVIAAFVDDAITRFPGTRILVLAHQKELVSQDSEKLSLFGVGHGIFCNGLGRKEIANVTVASIQSIARNSGLLGEVDVMIVDEAHRIGTDSRGQYRQLYEELVKRQPGMRLIGFTATPFRTGHGRIYGEKEFFNSIIRGVSIFDLQEEGRLVRLISKATGTRLDTTGVRVSRGDFVERELAEKIDVRVLNEKVIDEVIERASDRHSWLVFCAGVEHAEHVAEVLAEKGISSACVTGKTSEAEREDILERFKSGSLRAVTNCNVLTTGFDAPNVDCLVLLRPTLSPVLHVQILGRGLRTIKDREGNTLWDRKKDCLVLDFAGNVLRHGPIVDVDPDGGFARREGRGLGAVPSKVCPDCQEIVLLATKVCPVCGHSFEKEKSPYVNLSLVDPNGTEAYRLKKWKWCLYANARGTLSFMIDLYCEGKDFTVFYPVAERMNGLLWKILKTYRGDGRNIWPIHRNEAEFVRRMNAIDVEGHWIRGHYNERRYFSVTNWDYQRENRNV